MTPTPRTSSSLATQALRPHRGAPRRAVLVLLAGLSLVAAGVASADPALRQHEALRARLLDHPAALPTEAEGRRKADEVGAYDLQSLTIALGGGAPGRLPVDARFEVTFVVERPLDGALVLLAAFFEPFAVRWPDGSALNFQHAGGTGELLVQLDRPLLPGETHTLLLDAPFAPACAEPSGCVDEGPLRHVVEYGWYPLSAEFPLSDRFQVSLALESAASDHAAAVGVRVSDGQQGARRHAVFETETPTTLVAFALAPGPLVSEEGGAVPLDLVGPSSAAPDLPVARLAADAVAVYAALYGPYPFSRLGVAAIADRAGVGIGPQAHVFLPEQVWSVPEGGEGWSLVRQVTAHELGHQYFPNLLAIADARDLWLSEGFAEFAATRYSERQTGTDDHFRTNYWAYVQGVPPEGDSALWSERTLDGPYRFELAYQKASAVLEMLRRRLGTDAFDEILRRWVRTHAGQIVTTPELVEHFVAASPVPVRELLDAWVLRAGFPVLRVRATPARGAHDPVSVRLEVEPGRMPAFAGEVPLRLRLADGTTPTFAADLRAGVEHRFQAGPVQGIEVDPELTLFRRVRPDPPADVDLSGVVDGADLLDVWAAAGREVPDVAWDDQVDVNRDGVVDEHDLRAVREALGQGW